MEIINPSGSEFETQPGRTTKSERPWIGDLPGQGSEGPTDIPNKDDSCPTCGQPHSRGEPVGGTPLGHSDSPAKYINPNNPVADPQKYYRGEQQGRGSHFDSGHQKAYDEHGRLTGGASGADRKAWLESDKFNSPAFKQHGLSAEESRILRVGSGPWWKDKS